MAALSTPGSLRNFTAADFAAFGGGGGGGAQPAPQPASQPVVVVQTTGDQPDLIIPDA